MATFGNFAGSSSQGIVLVDVDEFVIKAMCRFEFCQERIFEHEDAQVSRRSYCCTLPALAA